MHENVSSSVTVTWQVTFEQICRGRQTAANLVPLMNSSIRKTCLNICYLDILKLQ